MLKGEDLFLALNMVQAEKSDEAKWLSENGYVENGFNTVKGDQFIEDFIQEHKNVVYESLKKNAYQQHKVREELGFKQPATLMLIIDKLVDEGLIQENDLRN